MQTDLTPRQLEIFHLVAKGLSNKEICELLGISTNTVKIHVTGILRALDVSNRTEAVFAYQHLLGREGESHTADKLRLADRLGRPALAVLPFENLLGDPAQDYVVEGLVEELLVRLSAWRWFPIITYASSRRFHPIDDDPKTVADTLGAQYLIYGSLRGNDRQIRVTTRLVDATTLTEIWSRTFDAKADDLFTLQEEVARQVVTVMAPELITAEAASTTRTQPSPDSTAWYLVCRGMWHIAQHTATDLEAAIGFFERAIDQASDFALAWHGLVCALELTLFEQWTDDPAQTRADVVTAAEKSARLDPESAVGLTDLGLARILEGRVPEALDLLGRAVLTNPSSARAISMLAQAQGMSGELDLCVMHLEDLLRIDPHSRSSARYRTIIAMCHNVGGRGEEAVRWSRDAIARDPNATGAYLAMISAFVELDDQSQAAAAAEELRANHPRFDVEKRLALMRPSTHPTLYAKLEENLTKAGLLKKSD